jgi:hypothetical protein
MQDPDPKHPTIPITHTWEHTSASSQSGRHYGKYCALLRDKAPTIGIIASVANFCFQWGTTITRWEKDIQAQLPKDRRTRQMTRIRRIKLIEGNLNTSLSELWGLWLMDNSKTKHFLHRTQFGLRKGQMAVSAVLI